MPLPKTTVAGVAKYADGNIARGIWMKYRPVAVFGDGGEIVLGAERQFLTDLGDGSYSFELSRLPAGSVLYDFDIPVADGVTVRQRVEVPDDLETTSLDELVNAYNGSQAPTAAASILSILARLAALENTPPGSAAWGAIGGDIADQEDLQELLSEIPGTAGQSAYEIAVAEGFSGTVEEWLESLTGPEGPQGETGGDGERGSLFLGRFDDIDDLPTPSVGVHKAGDYAYVDSLGELWQLIE